MSSITSLAVVGDHNTAFPSHRELDAALARLPEDVEARWVGTQAARDVDTDGVWVAPGSPYVDEAAVIELIDRCRRDSTPLLATCSGFQYAAITLARELAGVDARHGEQDPEESDPFVAPLPCSLDGEARDVRCVSGTRIADLLGTASFPGIHFCGYGLAEHAPARLERAGVTISAWGEETGAEALELDDHPFFLATLFQPQVGASSGQPLSPLITAFVAAAQQRASLVHDGAL